MHSRQYISKTCCKTNKYSLNNEPAWGWADLLDSSVPRHALLIHINQKATFQHCRGDAIKPERSSTAVRAACRTSFRKGFFRYWQRQTLLSASPVPVWQLAIDTFYLQIWTSLELGNPWVHDLFLLFLPAAYRPEYQRVGRGKRRQVPMGKWYWQKFEKTEVWLYCGILNHL